MIIQTINGSPHHRGGPQSHLVGLRADHTFQPAILPAESSRPWGVTPRQ